MRGADAAIFRRREAEDVGDAFQEGGFSGSAVATFGDGPVEMRETRKRDSIAVGVASDEVRRFGLSPTKRSRLIRAGADLIVPDFSQHEKLMEMLFPEC